jgi:Holliday junction resolvase-like predicted endonuclease
MILSNFAIAAEDAVDNWLQSKDWRRIHRNVSFKSGELDWIGWHDQVLTIVEIKASQVSVEQAAARIDYRKTRKLQSLTQEYLKSNEIPESTQVEIKVVIALNRDNHWSFELFDLPPNEEI